MTTEKHEPMPPSELAALSTHALMYSTVLAGLTMREAQRAYFERREKSYLIASKRAETTFDLMADAVMKRIRDDQLKEQT